MKVILVNPPICIKDVYGRFAQLASFQPPTGLAHLAGYLLQYGHEVEIVDANCLSLTIEDIVKEIKKYPPDLVGLYTISYNFPVIETLTKSIREAVPSLKMVAGGPHATFMPEQTLQETPIDFCVMGEGEETLHELVEHLEDGAKDFSSIEGMAYRTSEGEIKKNGERVRVKELDELPYPAIDLLPPLNKYKLYLLHHKKTPYFSVASSRGCPYKCVFCETPSGKIVRAHSAEYTADYLQFLEKKHGVKEIHFVDDTFTLNEKRIFRLTELMHQKNIDLSWYGTAHANVKNMDIFKAMKAAGCWIAAVGIESGSQKVIDMLDKGTTKERMQATCEGVLAAGLKLKTFFVLGNPGETVNTIEETIAFAKSLKGHFPVFSLMTPYPGAPLYENAEKFGTFDRSGFDKLKIATDDPVFIPYGLTKEILIKKQKQAFRNLYFNPSMVFRHLISLDSPMDAIKLTLAFKAYMVAQFTFMNVQAKSSS